MWYRHRDTKVLEHYREVVCRVDPAAELGNVGEGLLGGQVAKVLRREVPIVWNAVAIETVF